jgi:hypothetical protein
MVRVLRQQFILVVNCSLKKNFDSATNTAGNIGFVGSTGFLIYELKTKLIGINDPFLVLLLVPMLPYTGINMGMKQIE